MKTSNVWIIWLIATIAASGTLAFLLFYEVRSDVFLPGTTSHGHYQIEMKCSECHTPFMGVKQDSCLKCHEQELKDAEDSHPEKKIRDPRNADRVAKLDARYCITCHEEHVPERTQTMGVTLPMDYCYHCHQTIAEERPSHEGMGYDTCATAGCHNFHDNKALYEDFLLKHADQPNLIEPAKVPVLAYQTEQDKALTKRDANEPHEVKVDSLIYQEWEADIHAAAGVNCMDCHSVVRGGGWVAKPGHTVCKQCHETQTEGFLSGRHGMRLAQELSPMQPAMARLPFKEAALHKTLDCNACHAAHNYDTHTAAVSACLSCHDDQHSVEYTKSPHYTLWFDARTSGSIEEGVSCATCHMPRVEIKVNGEKIIAVQHNQNDNLRPNEKMIRTVCLHCHGLEFSIDALADPSLITNNFQSEPSVHIESIDMAVARDLKIKAEREQ